MTGEGDRPQENKAPQGDELRVAESMQILNPGGLTLESTTTGSATDNAARFRAPDFLAPGDRRVQNPTDAAPTAQVPPENAQQATDVANLFSAVARGDKAQVIALQSKLLGNNDSFSGSYMGQNFRISREKYTNARTHRTYSEAQYMHLGNTLVSRTNVRRDTNRRDVQASGAIVSIARNTAAPGDNTVASGNTGNTGFLNADDQRSNDGRFVQALLPAGQNAIKRLVERAQSTGGADVAVGSNLARVNIGQDGSISTVVGRSAPEARADRRGPNERVRPPTERPEQQGPPRGQMETFLRENKDNKARELVGAISSTDSAVQARAIQQLARGGVQSLGFTRPGEGERPQELSFTPAPNGGRITVRMDGQILGHISANGRLSPSSLSETLSNLSLDRSGSVMVGIRGKPQKFELGNNPQVQAPAELRQTVEHHHVTLPRDNRPSDAEVRPGSTDQVAAGPVDATALRNQRFQQLRAELNAQGYSQVTNQQFRQGDLLATIKPDGQRATAVLKGLDSEGYPLVEDSTTRQTVRASDWARSINPEGGGQALVMRRDTATRSDLPPVEVSQRPHETAVLTGAMLARQAGTIREQDQNRALERLLTPHGIRLTPPMGSINITEQLKDSGRFNLTSENHRTGDIHILAPNDRINNGDTLDWDNKGSPGMVLGITNERGEIVSLSTGERIDESKFQRFTYRTGTREESAAPLEAAVVFGRLFPRAHQGEGESVSDPISISNVENRLKQADSRFVSQGQVNVSDLQSRIASMEVGTTLIMRGSNPNQQIVGVVGEAPAAPNSTERVRVLYARGPAGNWTRMDDTTSLQKDFTTANVYKPGEPLRFSGTTQSDRTFENLLSEVTKDAFNVGQLVGDPRARERFYSAIASGALPLDALKRYLGESGDRQADYMTRRQYGEMQARLRGFGGVGIEINYENNSATITDVLPNMPASRAVLSGTNQPFTIKPGDVITAVDRQPVDGKSPEETNRLIRGQPNTSVELELRRPKEGAPGQFETFRVQITRQHINPPTVKATMDSSGIVHLRIKQFNGNTAAEFQNEINRIKAEHGNNIRGYILDMRGNPGGLLDQSLQILSSFARPNTALLVERQRNGGTNENPQYSSFEYRLTPQGIARVPYGHQGPITANMIQSYRPLQQGLIDKPVSVLVDGRSASASEVVSSGLQDYGHTIYGVRTYGKGTVQTILGRNDGSGATVATTAQYLSALSHRWVGNANDIRRGVNPNVVVRARSYNYTPGGQDDTQLAEVRRLMLRSLPAR